MCATFIYHKYIRRLSMNETLETKNIYSGDSSAITPFKLIKRLILGSNKFLIVVIAYVAALVTNTVSAFSAKFLFGSVVEQITEMLSHTLEDAATEAITQIQAFASVFDSVFLGIVLIGMLPTVLMAVGCLLIYMGAKKDDPSAFCNGALLFRILFTYQNVVYSLGIALVVICVAAICVSVPEAAVIAIIVGIIILIPICIANSYYSKFAKMFKNLSTSVRTDINVFKVYSLVTVINWISAILGIISAVGSLGTNFMGSIGGLLTSVALIIVTTMFSEYKDEMGDPTKENIQAAKEYK